MDRRHRLASSRDFARALNDGARAGAGPIACAVVRRAGDNEAVRLGITVTRRTGSAVARNRAKRRLKAAFSAADVAAPGCDVVLIARGDVDGRIWKELVNDVRSAVGKAARAC